MDRYTHLQDGNLSDALDVLPDLNDPNQQAQRATGTDGKQACHLTCHLTADSERLLPTTTESSRWKLPGQRPAERARFPGKSGFFDRQRGFQ